MSLQLLKCKKEQISNNHRLCWTQTALTEKCMLPLEERDFGDEPSERDFVL